MMMMNRRHACKTFYVQQRNASGVPDWEPPARGETSEQRLVDWWW